MNLVNSWSKAAFAVMFAVGAGNHILSDQVDARLMTSLADGVRSDQIVRDCTARTFGLYSNQQLEQFGGVMLWPAVTKCVEGQKNKEIAEIRGAGTVDKILRPSPEGTILGAGFLLAALSIGSRVRSRRRFATLGRQNGQDSSPSP